MLTYKKNTLLALLANFKAKLYNIIDESEKIHVESWGKIAPLDTPTLETISRNITSIEKQIKKL